MPVRPDMETLTFHRTDPDLPPEALNDCFKPPVVPTLVHCIHCDEEFDSWRIVYRVRVDGDGKVRGFWECPMPGCGGAGFMFDIFPVDPNYVAEDGAPTGHWCDDDCTGEEDCDCEQCMMARGELDPDEFDSIDGKAAHDDDDDDDDDGKDDGGVALADGAKVDESGGQFPLDDLLPDADDQEQIAVTPQMMLDIERKLGMREDGPAAIPPPLKRAAPQPLPPNWRELLARQDEPDEHSAAGDDIPF